MGRHLAANALTFLIAGLVLFLGVLHWGRTAYEGPGPLKEETFVEVPRGANLSEVSDRLVEAGAISNGLVFRVAARYAGRDEELKYGVYRIPAGASMQEILDQVVTGGGAGARYQVTFVLNARGVTLRLRDVLAEAQPEPPETLEAGLDAVEEMAQSGESMTYRVGVSEGLTVGEVLTGLAAIPYLKDEIGEAPPEGMLAPDTYSFARGASRPELVAKMRAAQEARLQEAWDGRQEGLPLESPEELLTLASIVEKETGVPEERRDVAAVFVNRLEQGMRLQTDPSIVYGITRGKEPLDRPIRQSDIDGATERKAHGEVAYNTYQIDGLPPGPIANPGRAALEAAAHPSDVPYLYFVADGSGGHAFSETLAEHNRNVAEYRKLQNGQ